MSHVVQPNIQISALKDISNFRTKLLVFKRFIDVSKLINQD